MSSTRGGKRKEKKRSSGMRLEPTTERSESKMTCNGAKMRFYFASDCTFCQYFFFMASP